MVPGLLERLASPGCENSMPTFHMAEEDASGGRQMYERCSKFTTTDDLGQKKYSSQPPPTFPRDVESHLLDQALHVQLRIKLVYFLRLISQQSVAFQKHHCPGELKMYTDL